MASPLLSPKPMNMKLYTLDCSRAELKSSQDKISSTFPKRRAKAGATRGAFLDAGCNVGHPLGATSV